MSEVGDEVGWDRVKRTGGEVRFGEKFGQRYISNGGEAG